MVSSVATFFIFFFAFILILLILYFVVRSNNRIVSDVFFINQVSTGDFLAVSGNEVVTLETNSGSNVWALYQLTDQGNNSIFQIFNIDANSAIGYPSSPVEGDKVTAGGTVNQWQIRSAGSGQYNIVPSRNTSLSLSASDTESELVVTTGTTQQDNVFIFNRILTR